MSEEVPRRPPKPGRERREIVRQSTLLEGRGYDFDYNVDHDTAKRILNEEVKLIILSIPLSSFSFISAPPGPCFNARLTWVSFLRRFLWN